MYNMIVNNNVVLCISIVLLFPHFVEFFRLENIYNKLIAVDTQNISNYIIFVLSRFIAHSSQLHTLLVIRAYRRTYHSCYIFISTDINNINVINSSVIYLFLIVVGKYYSSYLYLFIAKTVSNFHHFKQYRLVKTLPYLSCF